MSSKYLRKTVLAIALMAGIFIGAGRSSGSSETLPDFSGRWTLDLSRSKIHPAMAKDLTAGFFEIDHREPSFTVHRKFILEGKPDTLDFSLKTDGVEVEGNEGGMPTRASLRWDGDALVYLTIYKAPRGEARNTVVYWLLDEGKTLRAEESFRGPRLSYDNIWIFSKGE